MKENEKPENIENLENQTPSLPFLPSHFEHRSTVGGVGGMALPMPLEIVATDRSLEDNEGAFWELGVVGREAKNTSCSELGDENVSYSERGGLQLQGVQGCYICWWLPSSWVVSHGFRARKEPAKSFSDHLRVILSALRPIGNGF